jgi:hypothetical protein
MQRSNVITRDDLWLLFEKKLINEREKLPRFPLACERSSLPVVAFCERP